MPASPPTSAPSKPRRLGKKLLLAAGMLLLSFAVGELALRLLFVTDGKYRGRPLPPLGAINHDGQQQWYEHRLRLWQQGRPEALTVTFDQQLGWTFRPNLPGQPRNNNDANALAARGPREYAPLPPASVDRVLTFGDSFTYCNNVGNDETWQVAIEAIDAQLEVINFGVPSYGTDQALLRFRRRGPGLGARAMLLGIMLENIGRNVNRYRPVYFALSGTLGIKPRFRLVDGELVTVPLPYENEGQSLAAIGDGSVVDTLAEHEYWRDRPPVPFGDTFASLRLLCGYLGSVQRRPENLWRARDAEPYLVTLAILKSFAKEARAAGADLPAIVVFPTEQDVTERLTGRDKYWQPMLDELATAGVAAIDLTDELVRRCDGRADNVYAGGHLNARGNRIAGELLQAWLRERL